MQHWTWIVDMSKTEKMPDVELPANPPKYSEIAGTQKHDVVKVVPEKKISPKQPSPSPAEDLSWKTVIYEYTQNTTIHGVRYITENSVFPVRRVLWAIMVTAAFSFFIYYSQDRLSFYFKFTKNINVEVKYLDKVPFPAVTLCNQNAFRISAVYERGWYYTVKELFTRSADTLKRSCGSTEFVCHSDLSCIPLTSVCDIFPDCMDNSDENYCTFCPLVTVSSERTDDIQSPLKEAVTSSIKFEEQPLTFPAGEHVYITRTSPYLFIYKLDGYWLIAGRYHSDKPLARIKHYAIVPQNTSMINSTFEGDPDVWQDWEILVGDQWEKDPSFDVSCAHAFLDLLVPENITIDEKLSLEELYTNASHEQSEFIQSCKWKGVDCEPTAIKKRTTDMGICYTFNSSDMFVEQSGPGNGLSLVINVEQYEYTKNTEDGIGIKLLMHHMMDEPLMQERGQAVSPGLYSFISVETTKVSNLAEPWDDCGAIRMKYFDEYSITRCKVDCETQYVDKHCRCRELQMPSKEGLPEVCNVGEYINCAKYKLDELRAAGNECSSCPKPCESVQYVPTTSFSVILGEESTSQDEKTARLQEKLFRAREVTYRVVREKYIGTSRTFHIMNQQMLYMKKFTMFVEESLLAEYDSATTHVLEVKADCVWMRNIMFETRNAIEADILVELVDFKNVLLTLTSDAFVQLDLLVNETLEVVQMALDQYGDMWPLMIQGDPLHVEYARPLDDYVNKTIQRNNMTIWQTTKELLSSLAHIRNDVHAALYDKLQTMDTTQYQKIAINKTLMDPIRSDIGEHCDWCVQNETEPVIDILLRRVVAKVGEETQQRLDRVIADIQSAIDDYLSESWVKWFWTWVRFPITNQTLIDFRARIRAAHDLIELMDGDAQAAAEDTQEVLFLMDDLVDYAWGLQCQIKLPKLLNEYSGNQVVTDEMLRSLYDYIEKQNTEFHGFQANYTAGSITLEYVGSQLRTRFDEISNKIHGLKLRLDSSINSRSLLLTDIEKQINQIYFVIMAETGTAGALANVSDYWSTFDIRRPDAELPTTKHIGDVDLPLLDYSMLSDGTDRQYWIQLVDDLKEYQTFLQLQLNELDYKLAIVKEYFDLYISGNQINNDFYSKNFLSVDVFYKELTENKVAQQKAYRYQNLLSELGGLMGLLLGASVLTIGEIADLFIYNAFRKRFKSKVVPSK